MQDRYAVLRRDDSKIRRFARLVNSQTSSLKDADAKALASDWNAVASDMKTVLNRLVAKYHLPSSKAHSPDHTKG